MGHSGEPGNLGRMRWRWILCSASASASNYHEQQYRGHTVDNGSDQRSRRIKRYI